MRWSWHGAVAFVLALSLSASLITAFVSVAVSTHPITAAGANLLSTTVGGIIGALSTYLGIQSRRTDTGSNNHEDDDA